MKNLHQTHQEITFKNGSKLIVPKSDECDCDYHKGVREGLVPNLPDIHDDTANRLTDKISSYINAHYIPKATLREKLEGMKYSSNQAQHPGPSGYNRAINEILEALGI